MILRFFILFISTIYTLSSEVYAQEFTKAYGNDDKNVFESGLYSASHNAYFVVGSANDTTLTITKIDLSGNIIWAKKYSGKYHIASIGEIQTPDKNTTDIIVAPNEYGTYQNLYVMRIDGVNGNVIWSKRYRYSEENRFTSLIITKDQHIIASTNVSTGGLFALKIDHQGAMVWSKLINGNNFQRTTHYVSDDNGIVFGCNLGSNHGIAKIAANGEVEFLKKSSSSHHIRHIVKNQNSSYTFSGYSNWNTRAINHELIYTDEKFNVKWARILNPINTTSGSCNGCANVPTFVNNNGEIISIRESAISGQLKFSFSKFSASGEHMTSVATNFDDLLILQAKYGSPNQIVSIGISTREDLCLPNKTNGLFASIKNDIDICDTYEFTPRITNKNVTFTDIDKNLLKITNANFNLTDINTVVTNNLLKARNLCSTQEEKVNLGPDISACLSGNITLNAGTGYKSYTWSTGASTPTLQVSSSGTYWVRTVDDCDRVSSDTIRVTISQVSSRNQTVSICQGASYAIGNNRYTTAGNYSDTLKNIAGCDSIVRTTLTVKPNATKAQSFSICQGDSVRVGNKFYKTAGIFRDTLNAGNGCDSLITTTITLKPNATKAQSFSICQGDSVRVGNKFYKTAGTFRDTLNAANGCDSILTTSIRILPQSQASMTYHLCAGQSIKVGQNTYSSTGVYTDILKNIQGCDSTITTNLFVANTQTDTKFFSICKGDSLIVNNQTYFSEGTFSDTIRSGTGCDSIYSSIQIAYVQELHLDLGADTSVCSDEILSIGTDIQEVSYIWNNGATESHIDAAAPGIYSLTISNTCYSDTDTIAIEAIDCDCKVFIPNAFSPNGDGKNDVLIIKEENIISSRIIIYNKWGEEVFATENNQLNWNGVHRNKQLPPDVYGYHYEGTCLKGSKVEYKGNITIVR